MTDSRVKKLAKILVEYSVKVKKSEKILISANQASQPLAQEVYKLSLLKGAHPHLVYNLQNLDYFFFSNATQTQLTKKPEIALFFANWADKFIRLYSSKNNRNLSSINPKKLMTKAKASEPVKNIMLKKPWVLTEFPSDSMAQSANMSIDELEDLYFKACLQDWAKIRKNLTKLKNRLDNAKKVQVLGYKTDLSLSFTNRYFEACSGTHNMPDGEVFGAPNDQSAEGRIFFDLPSLRSGHVIKGVSLTFNKGKVIKASAQTGNKYLQVALKTDTGAKRLGEFAIGANFGIKKPMLNTLFDEKIGGTIHMALGSAFPEKNGGGINKSAIHWDLVKSMKSKDSVVLINNKPILKAGKLLIPTS